MIDPQSFGFAKFVPGFDFLQNLAQATPASVPQMPDLSHWVAPTLDLEELDKRIQEFKAVQFWLEQNAKALAATIQALEVQKMTLATLKGMNYQMADLAEAMKIKPQAAAAASPFATSTAAGAAAASSARPFAQPEPSSATRASRRPARPSRSRGAKAATTDASSAQGVVDPMQWWGSLTQQFQQIASQALQDVAQQGAAAASSMGGAGSGKTASKAGAKTARKSPAKASKKAAAKKTTTKTAGASVSRHAAAARSPTGPRR